MADNGTTIAKAYVQILPSTEGIKSKLTSALGGDAEAAGSDFGKKFGNAIIKAVAALGIGAAINKAVTSGMDFESSMAKTGTLFSGTAEQLDELKQEILGISSATGVAASELAEAAYSAESASVPMENLGGMIEASAKLATAGFTDIDTALSATAKTMNAYGMMSEDASETQANMDKVMRILIQTQNRGITTVGELGASLSNVTPTAAAFGVSFEQVGAALAGMTAQGAPTAQATTQLNALLGELGKKGTNAQKALSAAAQGTKYAGMSFAQMMASGADLNDVLGMLQGYADKSKLSIVDLFSSMEAGRAALSLLNSDWTGNMEAMATGADVVGAAYGTMTDTVAFKLDRMKTSLQNIGITAFNVAADTMGRVLDGISLVLERISPLLQTFGTAVLDMGAAFLSAVGSMMGFPEEMSASEVAAQLLTNIIQTLTKVVQFLTQHMDVIAPVVLGVVAAFTALKAAMAISSIISGVSAAIGFLASPVGIAVAAIAALVAAGVAMYKNWDKIKSKAAELWNAVKQSWNNLKQSLTNIFDNIRGAWNSFINSSKAFGTNLIDKVRSGISERFSSLGDTVSKVIEAIRKAFENFVNAAKTLGGNIILNIRAGFGEKVRELYSTVTTTITEIVNAFKNLIEAARNWGRDIIQNFLNGIGEKWNGFVSTIQGIGQAVADRWGHSHPKKGPMADDYKWMPDMMQLFADGIRDNAYLVRNELERSVGFGQKDLMPAANGDYFEVPRAGSGAAGAGGRDLTVILELDRVQLGRAVYRLNNEETQRVGVSLAGGYA